ncbi:MAG: hypothetical protein ACXVSF_06445 [Solirubrobacteraceae bacterium]
MSETNAIRCDRCGREEMPEGPGLLPPGWEGAVETLPPHHAVEAVCPGCQYAAWHPHCTSLIDIETGERVDPGAWDAMPEAERDYSRLAPCEYIDTSVAWTDDDDPPTWRCPSCGGSAFDGVHRDYPPGGLAQARYRVDDADEVDD